MENFKYILFHLPMIQEIFKKPKNGISDIFDVGIYNVSQTLKIDKANALKQAVYWFYQNELPGRLSNYFQEMIDEEYMVDDDYYRGFLLGDFNPEEQINAIRQYDADSPQDVLEDIYTCYRLIQTKTVLNMTYGIDPIIETYELYDRIYGGFKNQPTVMITTKMMLDYYEHTKTDYEKALFAMYAGIRSIIGNKDFAETTSDMIKCRMFGAKNQTELKNVLADKKVKAAYNKYTTQYHYKKMLKELLARNFLSSEIGYNRRTYVSCKLNMQQLEDGIVDRIRHKSLKVRLKEVEDNRLQALNSLKQRLNN